MNEDNLNMEIRKFLKKVGITSQRIIENEIYKAHESGLINKNDQIEVQMTLEIKTLETKKLITDMIKID